MPRISTQAIHIYTNNSLIRLKLDALREHTGKKMKYLMADWVEEAAASTGLQKKLQKFYRQNTEFWTDEGVRANIRIDADLDTISRATILGYELRPVLKGTVSEACQLLVNYHFSQAGLSLSKSAISKQLADMPTVDNERRRRASKRGKTTRTADQGAVKTSFSFDQETLDLFNCLIGIQKMRAGELVASLLDEAAASPDAFQRVKSYPKWEQQKNIQSAGIRRFNLSGKDKATLAYLQHQVIGKDISKSALVRVLVRLKAVEVKLISAKAA